jgi:CRISPR-associated protein Cas1
MSRRALNVLEPWSTVDYLHEFIDCQTKHSLVYDLQEPFRWIADVAVMEAFESRVLDLPDFYFTGDDYRYRFDPEAKQRFLDLLRGQFNSGVRYERRVFKWDTVIERKAIELSRHLSCRRYRFDLLEPSPRLRGVDDESVRREILTLSQSKTSRLGIAKSTLHHLRRRSRTRDRLRVYTKTRKKFLSVSYC